MQFVLILVLEIHLEFATRLATSRYPLKEYTGARGHLGFTKFGSFRYKAVSLL